VRRTGLAPPVGAIGGRFQGGDEHAKKRIRMRD
jgi:hypothetical protein